MVLQLTAKFCHYPPPPNRARSGRRKISISATSPPPHQRPAFNFFTMQIMYKKVHTVLVHAEYVQYAHICSALYYP